MAIVGKVKKEEVNKKLQAIQKSEFVTAVANRFSEGVDPELLGTWRYGEGSDSIVIRVLAADPSKKFSIVLTFFDDLTFHYRIFDTHNMHDVPSYAGWLGAPRVELTSKDMAPVLSEIGRDLAHAFSPKKIVAKNDNKNLGSNNQI